jgi:hypothetical protein
MIPPISAVRSSACEKAPRRRFAIRFTLRSLLVAVAFSAIVVAWFVSESKRFEQNERLAYYLGDHPYFADNSIGSAVGVVMSRDHQPYLEVCGICYWAHTDGQPADRSRKVITADMVLQLLRMKHLESIWLHDIDFEPGSLPIFASFSRPEKIDLRYCAFPESDLVAFQRLSGTQLAHYRCEVSH